MKQTTLVAADDIHARVDEIAASIARDFPDEKPLFVALLRGAMPFAAKLMFAITRVDPDFQPELDYMMVSTYGAGRSAGEPHIVTDLAPDTTVAGRTVVVVDDVLDKGITAHFVMAHMSSRGARTTKLAVLAEKKTERAYAIEADYCGFTFDDDWLVGMGMDDASAGKEHSRWQDSINKVA